MEYSDVMTFTATFDPEITFDVYKPSYGRKLKFDEATEAFRDQALEIEREHAELYRQYTEVEQAHRYAVGRKVNDLKMALGKPDADKEALEKQIAEEETARPNHDPELIEKLELVSQRSLRLMSREYNPARLRWGLAGISGLTIKGQPATVETLIASGPEALVWEILDKIEAVSGLKGAELKNSQLPITFNAAVQGSETPTTATNVSAQETTEPETVTA